MAIEDPEAAPSTTAASSPTAAPPPIPAGKGPRRGPLLAIIVLVPVAVFVFLVIVGMFAPKPKPSDATSVLRALANDPGRATEARIEGNLAETSAPGAPAGIQADFLWTGRPSSIDAEIATFDTIEHAAAGFEQFKDPGSLLVPSDDGDTSYSGFDQGEVPANKRFYCALNAKGFACGSLSAGLPIIVILREPPQAALPASDPSDPMGGFARLERTIGKTAKMGHETGEVDTVLQRLGITVQPTAQ